MNSFVLALASIALVLVNMGIGWSLAKYHSRRHPEPAQSPFPVPPAAEVTIACGAIVETTDEEAPVTSDLESESLESEPSDFSMTALCAPAALATAAAPQYIRD